MRNRIRVGDIYRSAAGHPWGTVLSISNDIVTVKLAVGDSSTKLRLYELAAWLRDGVLLDGIHYCTQCGKKVGPEWILGPVCGACTKMNHRKAVGNRRPR
jgi:hypothetical protein